MAWLAVFLCVCALASARIHCCNDAGVQCAACPDPERIEALPYARLTSSGDRPTLADCKLTDTRAACVRARLGGSLVRVGGTEWQGAMFYLETSPTVTSARVELGDNVIDMTKTAVAGVWYAVVLRPGARSWDGAEYLYSTTRGTGQHETLRDPWAMESDGTRSVLSTPVGWVGGDDQTFVPFPIVLSTARVYALTGASDTTETVLDRALPPGINVVVFAGGDWFAAPAGSRLPRLNEVKGTNWRRVVETLRSRGVLVVVQVPATSVDAAQVLAMILAQGADGVWLTGGAATRALLSDVRASTPKDMLIADDVSVADAEEFHVYRVEKDFAANAAVASHTGTHTVPLTMFRKREHKTLVVADAHTLTQALLSDGMPAIALSELDQVPHSALVLAEKRAQHHDLFVQPSPTTYPVTDADEKTWDDEGDKAMETWNTAASMAVYLSPDHRLPEPDRQQLIALVNLDDTPATTTAHRVRFYQMLDGAMTAWSDMTGVDCTPAESKVGWHECSVPAGAVVLLNVQVTPAEPGHPTDARWRFASIARGPAASSSRAEVFAACDARYGADVCNDPLPGGAHGMWVVIGQDAPHSDPNGPCPIERMHKYTAAGVETCGAPRLGITPWVSAAMGDEPLAGYFVQTVQPGTQALWLVAVREDTQAPERFAMERVEDGLFRLFVASRDGVPDMFVFETDTGAQRLDAWVQDWSNSVMMPPLWRPTTVERPKLLTPDRPTGAMRVYESVPGAVDGFLSADAFGAFLASEYLPQLGFNALLLDGVYMTKDTSPSAAESLFARDVMHTEQTFGAHEGLRRMVDALHARDLCVLTTLDLAWFWEHREQGIEPGSRPDWVHYVVAHVVDMVQTDGVDGFLLRLPPPDEASAQVWDVLRALERLPFADRVHWLGEVTSGDVVYSWPVWQALRAEPANADDFDAPTVVQWSEHAFTGQRVAEVAPGNEMALLALTVLTPGVPVVFHGQEFRETKPARTLYAPQEDRISYYLDPADAAGYTVRKSMGRKLRGLMDWRASFSAPDDALYQHNQQVEHDGRAAAFQLWTVQSGHGWLVLLNLDEAPYTMRVQLPPLKDNRLLQVWPDPQLQKALLGATAPDVNGTAPQHNSDDGWTDITIEPHQLIVWQFNHTGQRLVDRTVHHAMKKDNVDNDSNRHVWWIVLVSVLGAMVLVLCVVTIVRRCRRRADKKQGKKKKSKKEKGTKSERTRLTGSVQTSD